MDRSATWRSASIPLTSQSPNFSVSLEHSGAKTRSGRTFSSQSSIRRKLRVRSARQKYGDGDRAVEWQWWKDDRHVRAVYWLNSTPPENYLELTPLGWEMESPRTRELVTRIDLAVDTPPGCKFAVAERCLIAFAAYRYPGEYRKQVSYGAVTLTGRISRSGKVEAIRETGKTTASRGLAAEAIDNLKTWRFEPASREDPIEITYTWTSSGAIDVLLELPHRITFGTRATDRR